LFCFHVLVNKSSLQFPSAKQTILTIFIYKNNSINKKAGYYFFAKHFHKMHNLKVYFSTI